MKHEDKHCAHKFARVGTHSEPHIHCSCGCGHEHSHDHDDEDRGAQIKKLVIATVLFVIALVFEHLDIPLVQFWAEKLGMGTAGKSIASAPFYFAAYIIVGKEVVLGSVANIRKGEIFGEEFLMTIASFGGVFLGELSEAVAVMLFYQLGEFFQDYAVDKSRDSIASLMKIRPDHATVVRGGKSIRVEPEEVSVGEIIEVRAGERLALDGIVVEGESFVDTSALTGESVPRSVREGSEVLSGFVNNTGLLRVRVTKKYSESAVSRILELTQNASSVKAKSENFIRRFAKVYTPIVCVLALCVAIIPPIFIKFFMPELFGQLGFSVWVYRALSFLVVSCPCALVISVPLSFFSGIGAASAKGILIKGSNFMESLAKTKIVVFDKTGTLTHGVFKVSSVNLPSGSELSRDELLMIASHAESYSNHPISKSLKEAHLAVCSADCCNHIDICDVSEISGHGVKVLLGGKKVLVGNALLMEKEKVAGFGGENSGAIGTIVHVAIDGSYAGNIVISDKIKDESKNALAVLKNLGVRKNVMLTGDTNDSARKVASELEIDEFHAQLLPAQKVQKVEELMADGEKLAFVGDGINDSPVLARADAGIAMGALGSDAAIEAADIVLMDDNPEKICDAIRISRKTVAIVNENIVFSLAIKSAIMIFGFLGLTNLWIAVFGDVGVCFLAVLNAMRAMRVKN